jgi:ribosome biogenesis GTPase / thiamine phosphate phosphatase
MTSLNSELADFGWNTSFAVQLAPEEQASFMPVRVMAVHRDCIHVASPAIDMAIPPFVGESRNEESIATIGDWLLLEAKTMRPRRILLRRSLFKRRAAGTARRIQLIAANVDTLFIVSSCNQDFNLARLERYLVLAKEAEVTPVIVLTKADLTEDPADFIGAVAKLLPGLCVEAVDARHPKSVANLVPWCARGQTIALVGSSGVGKSTLINTLTGDGQIATSGIRGDDDKGRHTTTGRQLHRLPAGGWLLDTPGMRELQLTDVRSGLEEVFADIVAIAANCRFRDCQHQTEPGCALLAAIESGVLDTKRVKRWRKLAAEEAFNTESLAERRARERAFGKLAKRVLEDKRLRRGD